MGQREVLTEHAFSVLSWFSNDMVVGKRYKPKTQTYTIILNNNSEYRVFLGSEDVFVFFLVV